MISKYKSVRLFGVVALATAVFTWVGCQTKDKPADEKQRFVLPDSLYKTIEIDSARMSKVINSITLTGKVDFNADKVFKIFPPISGVIQQVNGMLGDYVKSGQVLAVVKSGEMAGFSNDLITAETNLQVAKKSLDAANDMFKSGLMSQKDQLAAQAAYDQAKASLEKAQRIIQLNGGTQNGEYIAKTPIGGFIVERFVTNNMVIRADNSTPMFTISDLKNVWIIANVYESNIPFVRTGDSVTVTTLSYPGKIFRGRVDRIMNVLDPTNKVMKVRIVLPNPDYMLKPEMFANVTVNTIENKKMLSIPSRALIFDHSQYYVLVFKSRSDISIRPIEVANIVGDIAYITTGMEEGEKVIASQALLIYQELNS
ncbi:MAG: efflux RND transporter periplasmic adaptor subunit [Bacteroidetes bacterium]|nr:MAG: efflux RND transporter periplasmic adaptor subunit [Bacteroidota bacterium]